MRTKGMILGPLAVLLAVYMASCSGSGGGVGGAPAPVPSATLSDMVVSAATLTADGVATANVTVTVRDEANSPISGQVVSVTYSGSGTVTPPSATTNASGMASFQVTALVATTGSLSATVNPGAKQVLLIASPPLTFILPGCEVRAPAGSFTPVVKCEWTGPPPGDPWPSHINVLSAPVVIDMDLDGDPATIAPSIAFVTYNGTDGSTPSCVGDATYFGVLRVINGATCEQQFVVGNPKLIGATSLAAGDIDLAPDGRPEIIAVALGGHPVAFRYDSNAAQLTALWEATTPVSSTCLWTGPTLADLEGDGEPEVLLGGDVYSSATGTSLAVAPFAAATLGRFGIVVDLAGGRRLVAGGATYSWSSSSWALDTPGFGDGAVAAADFGTYGVDPGLDDRSARDGAAEVVTVAAGLLTVMTPAGRAVLGPLFLPNVGNGGPPAIADFDGDGRAEIAVSGASALVLVDPDCSGTVNAECPSGSSTAVVWSATIQDASSARSATAAFDFENDGAAEVVHADECYMSIRNGNTGAALVQLGRRSLTLFDMPVIADTDGDGRAEVVMNSNGNGSITCPLDSPLRTGIQVVGESTWARARPIWNQHPYTNGGITDVGVIPANPVPDFSLNGPNGFRLQDACSQ